ncbi:DUF3631 domain-containing protein [Streptomyces sp. NRRL WC-3742]|uniref:DUF3631 domain-containing protein n=1 Tax=Streptomyces sp. NRRL WC-3742 TaxID=1463934 RepID=UPI00068FE458|nr:DUF3631 domain-containing protein [Streptomyces sp. NRRL WC-3742]
MSLPSSPLKSFFTTARPGSEDGAALLDAVEAHHRRFTVFPSDAAYTAVVLWDAHTHLLDAFESTPRLALMSQGPATGKTRALAVIGDLVPCPVDATGMSPAALGRSISGRATRPTVLVDESDTALGPQAAGNEDLRGLINAGYRRSGVVLRCVGVGNAQTVRPFPAYAAIALAGLGDLPDSITSRAVVIRMRRRACDQVVEPYRERIHQVLGHILRDRLAAWADRVHDEVTDARPELPEGVFDRAADVWEPLLAVADAAGGHWPQRARTACLELVDTAREFTATGDRAV